MPLLRDQPQSTRPREKLIANGVQTLTTQEVLMTILGSGNRKHSVEKIAIQIEALLHRMPLQEISTQALLHIPGIGISKACLILGVFELTQRLQRKQELAFTSPSVAWSFLQQYACSTKEHLVCLYLNARYQLVHQEVLAVGSLNQLMIFPRDVFSPIKHHPVAAIILAHNHPSGNSTPSADDLTFTQTVKRAADLLGIELIDHIVLTKTGFYSIQKQEKH